jgi:hypothetical protein
MFLLPKILVPRKGINKPESQILRKFSAEMSGAFSWNSAASSPSVLRARNTMANFHRIGWQSNQISEPQIGEGIGFFNIFHITLGEFLIY